MAKKADGPPPSGPTTTAPTDTGQASGSAEPAAPAGNPGSPAPAPAEAKKKKGTRNIELRLMGYIDRRLRALPVKARKRVVEWMKEYDIEDEG